MKKRPVVNAILYIINNILVKAFQFFLVPIYTVRLTTEQYGVSNLVTSFTMIGGVLITLSIGSATSRYYVECKGRQKEEACLFSSLYLFITLFGLAMSVVLVLLRHVLSFQIFGSAGYQDIFVLSVINVWLLGIANQYKSVLMAAQEANTYTVVSIASFLLQLALTIYFILLRNAGVQGILYSMIISNILTIAISIVDLRRKKWLEWRMDKKIIQRALKYSLPLIPHSLSTTLAQFLSRIFIGNSYSLSTVGIYGLAGQFGNIIDTVQGSVHSAYLPWFFAQKKQSDDEAAKKVHRAMPVILDCYNVLFLGFILFSQEMVTFIAAKEYIDAWKLIPLHALNYAIKTPYYFYVSFLFYDENRVRFIFLSTLTSSILNVVLSAVLIPQIGMYGSILADVIATVVQIAFVIWLCRGENYRYFRYSLFFRSLLELVGISAIGLSVGFVQHINEFRFGYFAYKCLVWAAYCGWVFIKNRVLLTNAVCSLKRKLASQKSAS